MPLTVRAVDAAKPREKPYKLTDGSGLYLLVTPAGTKSWRSNYTRAGKQQTRTYGQFPAMSLADARKAHALARDKTEAPAPKKPTFKVVAKQWLVKHLPALSNSKHRIQVESTLEQFVYPKVGELPIDEIPRTMLVGVVKAVQTGEKRVETAHRVAGRVTAVFDYAQDTGIIDSHPASNLSRVLTARKTQKPMPSIPPEEAGELMRAIAAYPELVTRLALELMAYTFPRVMELLGFEKSELKENGAIWMIPAERMKMDLPHVIPLSTQARQRVARLMEMSGCELVIESPSKPGHKLSENTLLYALYRLGYRGRMSVHGFRALASTVMNEQSGFDKDVIERQLAHQEKDDVRAAYNRAQYLSQRRQLMQWWADWLDAQRAAQ